MVGILSRTIWNSPFPTSFRFLSLVLWCQASFSLGKASFVLGCAQTKVIDEPLPRLSSVSVGQTVLLGPDSLGAFIPTVVKSCQRKRVNVLRAEAGQSVSFALKRVKRTAVRKGEKSFLGLERRRGSNLLTPLLTPFAVLGMVLLEKTDIPPVSVRKFEGSCLILYHNTLITPRYQAMLHVGSVRQTSVLFSSPWTSRHFH